MLELNLKTLIENECSICYTKNDLKTINYSKISKILKKESFNKLIRNLAYFNQV